MYNYGVRACNLVYLIKIRTFEERLISQDSTLSKESMWKCCWPC
nr:MAG TPA: hypothetical protein [Caudoviricetes sp.]